MSEDKLKTIHYYDNPDDSAKWNEINIAAGVTALIAFAAIACLIFIPSRLQEIAPHIDSSEFLYIFETTRLIVFAFLGIVLFISACYLFGKASIGSKYKNILTDPQNYELHALERGLERGILKYNALGLILLSFSAILVLVFGVFIFKAFHSTIELSEKLKDTPQSGYNTALLAILYVLRTSLLGTLVISCLVYSLKLTKSSFDQGVRFLKRKHATKFLRYLLNHEQYKKENINIIMIAFEHWNSNIQSAFSDITAEKVAEPNSQTTINLPEPKKPEA